MSTAPWVASIPAADLNIGGPNKRIKTGYRFKNSINQKRPWGCTPESL
jgi:hypothetical protein